MNNSNQIMNINDRKRVAAEKREEKQLEKTRKIQIQNEIKIEKMKKKADEKVQKKQAKIDAKIIAKAQKKQTVFDEKKNTLKLQRIPEDYVVNWDTLRLVKKSGRKGKSIDRHETETSVKFFNDNAEPDFNNTLDNFNILLQHGYTGWERDGINVTHILEQIANHSMFLLVKYKNAQNILTTKYIPIKFTNINQIKNGILQTDKFIINYIGDSQSDDTIELDSWDIVSEIRIVSLSEYIKKFELQEPSLKKSRKVNGFYKMSVAKQYYGDFNLDLYQIFNQQCGERQDTISTQNKSCLIHVLENAIDKEQHYKIFAVQNYLLDSPNEINTPLCKLQTVADMIEYNIKLHMSELQSTNQRHTTRVRYYHVGKDKNNTYPTIEMVQDDSHYFIYEKTKYTSFYVKNYEKIKAFISKKPDDYEKQYSYTKERVLKDGTFSYICDVKNLVFLDSLQLVLLMKKNSMFVEYTASNILCDNFIPVPSLDNMDREQNIKAVGKSCIDLESGNKYIIISADCESMTNLSNGTICTHRVISFGYLIHDEMSEPIIITDKSGPSNIFTNIKKSLYKSIRNVIEKHPIKKPTIIMYFHNAKYDMTLLKGIFFSNSELTKDNIFYSADIWLNEFFPYDKNNAIKIQVRDSYKLFSMSLNDAAKMLQVDICKKEAMGYSYHNIDNMINHKCEIEKYKTHVKPAHRHLLLEAIMANEELYEYNEKDQTFNPTLYYNDYLKQDVNVLQKCLTTFRSLMFEITNQDVFDSLTISSIAHKYVIAQNCYTKCTEVSGLLRQYIQKTVRGGRVYANEKYKQTIIEENVVDFDAVSLYPSAMKRLCEEYGIPTGLVKKLPTSVKTIQDLPEHTFYCVRILITKINKTQQIPCLTIKQGLTLKYINELPDGKPYEDFVNQITLEDYIKYHEIEYEILDGIYWNQETNTNLGKIVEKLHLERKKHKKTNVPLATLIKLIMNSIYGKTCSKRSDKQTIFKSKKQAATYIKNNFGIIQSLENIMNENGKCTNVKLITRKYDESKSLNYIGSAILSMSKRIMSEVFDIMNDHNYPVYYTDTDSIHMREQDLQPLCDLYYTKYNRHLTSKDLELGQLHSDFSQNAPTQNVKSILHIPIASKIYMDVLSGDDTTNNKQYLSTHVRIKGITNGGINAKIQEIVSKLPSTTIQSKRYENLNRILHGDYTTNYGNFDEIEATIILFKRIMTGKLTRFNMNPVNTVSMVYSTCGVICREQDKFIKTIQIKNGNLVDDENYFQDF